MPDQLDSSDSSARLRGAFAAATNADDAADRRAAMLAVTASLLDQAGPRLVIDRYVVRERVGAGSMGVVYLADDPQLQRKVALKVVSAASRRRGAWQGEQSRLLREGQALARLSHPNVVPIYDVGLFADQVYLAMEFVEGETLAALLERRRLALGEALELLLAAGRGLAAAHAANIVHRDFKPANVIVGADGRVRVLDFGLACEPLDVAGAVGGAEGAETTSVGTPAYMAPEQERGRVGPAADQFSFCVTLYEALTGVRPFGGASVEQLRAAKVAGAPSAPRTLPRRLARALQRGLSFEPGERWPGLPALLRELERCLPRPRWQRTAVALGAAVCGGLVVLATQRPAVDVDGDCRRAAAVALAPAWDRSARVAGARAFAASGASHAQATWDRVADRLDAYADRWTTASVELCRADAGREVPDELAALRTRCLARRRGELQALVQVFAAADRAVVGRAVAAVAALPGVAECGADEALRVELSRPDDPELAAEVDRQRDALDAALADEIAGRYAGATARVEAVLTAARTLGFRPLRAEALQRRASLQLDTGDYQAAEAAYAEAQWELIATRQDRPAAIVASTRVFLVGDLLARTDEGRRLGREAEALVDRSGRARLAELALHTALGNLHMREGAYAAARVHLQAALELTDDALARAIGLLNLANVEEAEGAYAASCRLTREAHEIRARELGPGHPDLGTTLSNLGACLMLTGDFDGAEAMHREALEIWRASLGDRHERLALPFAALGDLDLQRGRLGAALAKFHAARHLWLGALGPDHPSVGYMDERIAAALLARGELAPAQQAGARALALWDRSASPDPQGLSLTLATLAEIARERGDRGLAGDLLARASAVASAAYGPGHLLAVTIEVQRSDLARELGDSEVRPRLESALATLEASFDAGSPWLLEPLLALAEAHLAADDTVAAAATARRAVALASAVDAPIQRALGEFLLARAIARDDPRRAASLAAEAAADLRRRGAGRHLARIAAWQP